MYIPSRSFLLKLTGASLLTASLGCSSVTLSKVEKKPLPPSPPTLHEMALILPPQGGPRQPAGSTTSPMALGLNTGLIPLETDASALRSIAEGHSGVQQALGERFAFIDSKMVPNDHCLITIPQNSESPPSRSTAVSSTDRQTTRLTYYSYSRNIAVHVCLKNQAVTSVQSDPRPGFQPEESSEELAAAIALARKDSRIAEKVSGLFGHAILTSPEEYRYFWVDDEDGFGNRVFWVTFSETSESLALFFARVDLTLQTVWDAGKEPGPQ